jgi:hypothetical protein
MLRPALAETSTADRRVSLRSTPCLPFDIIDTMWLVEQQNDEDCMADLLVRGIDDALVLALKERAVKHRRSAEADIAKFLPPRLRVPASAALPRLWLQCRRLAKMPTLNESHA